MNRLKITFLKLLYPAPAFALAIGFFGLAILAFVFVFKLDSSFFAPFLYPFSLYSVIVLVLNALFIMDYFKIILSKNKYGYRYFHDRGFQNKITLYCGFIVNLLFACFYLFTGMMNHSLWFGAVAAYYFLLSVLRFVLLKSTWNTSNMVCQKEKCIVTLKAYQCCGYLLFVLSLAMAGMVFQMIDQNKGYEYSGFTIYMSAFYAFYCLISAIISAIKSQKNNHFILSALKLINLVAALMSILALQTAMISRFGDNEYFRLTMNTITGLAVCFITVFIAIFMVMFAKHKLTQCNE